MLGLRFLLLASATLASSVPRRNLNYAIHEETPTWMAAVETKQDRLPSNMTLPMRIALRQRNLDVAEQWLMDVSDPDSAKFGQHWSQEAVIAAFKPSDESIDAVTNWLTGAGIAKERITHTDNKQWLAFDATTQEAEALLQTQYHLYKVAGDHMAAGCDAYSIPQHLKEHVDFIKPAVTRSKLSMSRSSHKRSTVSKKRSSALKERSPNLEARSTVSKASSTSSKATSASSTVSKTTSASSTSSKPSSKTTSASSTTSKTSSAVSNTSSMGTNTSRQPTIRHSSSTVSAPTSTPSNDLSMCYNLVTPACLRALYQFDIPDQNATILKNNRMGVFEADGESYAQGDLNSFFTTWATFIPNNTAPILDSIDGGIGPVSVANAGGEADLDFQAAYPIVYPQELVMYSVNDNYYTNGNGAALAGFANIFLDAIDGSYCTYSAFGETGDAPGIDPTYPDPHAGGYKGKLMCGVYKAENVISISYSTAEYALPLNYQKRQCNEWLKLGLQGSSVFIASGDSGVAQDPGILGLNPDGCLSKNGSVFNPGFPNGCPWITTVGATQINNTNSVYEPEVAANSGAPSLDGPFYYSGGGFSNVFPIPKYQEAAVAQFFASSAAPTFPYYVNGVDGFNGNQTGDDGFGYNKTQGLFNRNGRAFPDVAANGNSIAMYQNGFSTFGSGTSASTPIFAALIHRINDARLRAGKSPLGFINPTIYKNPGMLNDIVSGSNPACGSVGFSCGEGWDPVTGYGTPNYPKMLAYYMSLP